VQDQFGHERHRRQAGMGADEVGGHTGIVPVSLGYRLLVPRRAGGYCRALSCRRLAARPA
jgi:hypothetical protein